MTAKLLRLKQVQELVPWSRTTIWRKENAGEFPKHHRIGRNTIAWIDGEIQQWIKDQVEQPNPHKLFPNRTMQDRKKKIDRDI